MTGFYTTWFIGVVVGVFIGKWINDHYGGGGPRGGGEAVA